VITKSTGNFQSKYT